MTATEFRTLSIKRTKNFTVQELKKSATKIKDDLSTGADILMDVLLENLMKKISTDEFVNFCGTLE